MCIVFYFHVINYGISLYWMVIILTLKDLIIAHSDFEALSNHANSCLITEAKHFFSPSKSAVGQQVNNIIYFFMYSFVY